MCVCVNLVRKQLTDAFEGKERSEEKMTPCEVLISCSAHLSREHTRLCFVPDPQTSIKDVDCSVAGISLNGIRSRRCQSPEKIRK